MWKALIESQQGSETTETALGEAHEVQPPLLGLSPASLLQLSFLQRESTPTCLFLKLLTRPTRLAKITD